MKKKVLIACSAVAVVLVISVLGLALFFDANQFRPQLEQTMGEALGRKVTIGSMKGALLSGGVAVENLSIADDAAFSNAPFVTAKAVTVRVSLLRLIFSRRVRVQALRFEDPQVVLVRSASGQWNFSGLGGASAAAPSTATSVSIRKITIAGGRILVRRGGSGGKERVYDNVNLEVSNLSLTSQFPFRMTASTPGAGTVTLDGRAGPIDSSDVANTPFQATTKIAHLDVKSTGFIDPSSGLSGVVDFSGSLVSDGRQLTSKGKARATGVALVPGGAPAPVPIEIDYESNSSRKAQTGVVEGDVHVGKAVAHLTGDYNAAGEAITVRMKLTGENMPAPDLEAALPAIGVQAAVRRLVEAGHDGCEPHGQWTSRSPGDRRTGPRFQRRGRRFRSRRQVGCAVNIRRSIRCAKEWRHVGPDPQHNASRRTRWHTGDRPEPGGSRHRQHHRKRHDLREGRCGLRDASEAGWLRRRQ